MSVSTSLGMIENFNFVYNSSGTLTSVQYQPISNIQLPSNNSQFSDLITSINHGNLQPITSSIQISTTSNSATSSTNGAILPNISASDAENINSTTDSDGFPLIPMPISFDIYKHTYSQKYHRSGWAFILKALSLYEIKNKLKPYIILDPYIDVTFIYNRNSTSSPYKIIEPCQGWIGILHHPPLINAKGCYPTNYDANKVINNTSFQIALKTCRGIIVLSQYLKTWLQQKLNIFGFSTVPIYVLYHPTEIIPTTKMFSPNIFLAADPTERYIAQIGGWLRNIYAIYALPVDNTQIQKAALKGPNMDIYFKPSSLNFNSLFQSCICNNLVSQISSNYSSCDLSGLNIPDFNLSNLNLSCFDVSNLNISDLNISGCDVSGISGLNISSIKNKLLEPNKYVISMINYLENNDKSVTVKEYLEDDCYDSFLVQNIVFLQLIDASACNTVIECIVRCTPIVINRINPLNPDDDPLVEYLGDSYPLFYTNIAQAIDLINELTNPNSGLLLQTVLYLTNLNLNNNNLQIQTFLNGLNNMLTELNFVYTF